MKKIVIICLASILIMIIGGCTRAPDLSPYELAIQESKFVQDCRNNLEIIGEDNLGSIVGGDSYYVYALRLKTFKNYTFLKQERKMRLMINIFQEKYIAIVDKILISEKDDIIVIYARNVVKFER